MNRTRWTGKTVRCLRSRCVVAGRPLVGRSDAATRSCGDKAKDLYETAQLEEKQFNNRHATDLYRQIVEQYPDSPYTGRAKTRLAELEKR